MLQFHTWFDLQLHKPQWAVKRGHFYPFQSPLSTAAHHSSVLPVHTGTSRTKRKSFFGWKQPRKEGGSWGQQNGGPAISSWTNRPALSLTAHKDLRKKYTGEKHTASTQYWPLAWQYKSSWHWNCNVAAERNDGRLQDRTPTFSFHRPQRLVDS